MALVLAAALLVSPGCITFDGEDTIETRVLVTQDVGTEVLLDENVSLSAGASAMDALRSVAEVETSHGGGFIEAIEGIESRYPDEKVDWFYHVDGRLADVGAAQHTLEDGDVLVFDHRSWERTMQLSSMLTGLETWPADLTDPTFDREAFEQRQADEDRRASLYAHLDGDRIQLLDAEGRVARTVGAPWLLAHAVEGEEGPRVLLVASGGEARGLVDELDERPPTGLGALLTPDERLEVPAG